MEYNTNGSSEVPDESLVAAATGVAVAPKDDTLYAGLLRYHNENSSDDDSSTDRRRRKKMPLKSMNEDDRKPPPDYADRKQPAKPKAPPSAKGGLKPLPPANDLKPSPSEPLDMKMPPGATPGLQNFMQAPDPTSTMYNQPISNQRNTRPIGPSMGIPGNPVSPHRNPGPSSFYKAALEEARNIGKIESPITPKKPGVVMVNEPAVRPDSAMYRIAYGDERQRAQPMGAQEGRNTGAPVRQSKPYSRQVQGLPHEIRDNNSGIPPQQRRIPISEEVNNRPVNVPHGQGPLLQPPTRTIEEPQLQARKSQGTRAYNSTKPFSAPAGVGGNNHSSTLVDMVHPTSAGPVNVFADPGSGEHILHLYQSKKKVQSPPQRGTSPIRDLPNDAHHNQRTSLQYTGPQQKHPQQQRLSLPLNAHIPDHQEAPSRDFHGALPTEPPRPQARQRPYTSKHVSGQPYDSSRVAQQSYPSRELLAQEYTPPPNNRTVCQPMPSREYFNQGERPIPSRKLSSPEPAVSDRHVVRPSPRRSTSVGHLSDEEDVEIDEDLQLALEISKMDTGGTPTTTHNVSSIPSETVFGARPHVRHPSKEVGPRQSSFAKAAFHRANTSSLNDVLLALKLSAEESAGPSHRRRSTNLDELLALEMAEHGPNNAPDHSVTDLVAAGITADASTANMGSTNEQFKILEQIREERERKELELALMASQAESSAEVHRTQKNDHDFLLSQKKAMEEYAGQPRSLAAPQRQCSERSFDSTERRQELLQKGTQVTQEAISSGQAHIVTCQGCAGRLQAPVSYSLVFCPVCQTISPA